MGNVPTLLALDLGATKLRWGVVADDGVTILDTEATPRQATALVQHITERARELLGRHPACDGLAIAASGQVNADGTVVGSTKVIAGWTGTRLGPELHESLGRPVSVLNDANAAALAHWAVNPGHRLLQVSLGTGVGGGLVYRDGTTESGTTGRGGELGHTLLKFGGRDCACGRRGCVEAYLSGPAVTRRARRLLGRKVRNLEAVATLTDPVTEKLWRQVGRELAAALTSWDMAFECERYILAGGMVEASDRFWPHMVEALSEDGRPPPDRVERSTLGNAGFLLGAAVEWRRRYDPGFVHLR